LRLFIFGYGYSARAVVERMRPRLTVVWGTTREHSRTVSAPSDVAMISFDGASAAVSDALAEATHVLVSIPPGADGDPALKHHRTDLAALKPLSLVYLSTVGVYGDHGGAWVDEASECRPVSTRSRQRLAAEAEWQLVAEETGVPVAIIRLAGIYGPGRGPFEKIRTAPKRHGALSSPVRCSTAFTSLT
jgi:nucleoside-diphosphate-sugar epimerase